MAYEVCTEWSEESYDECEQYEDQGYSECDRYEDQGYKDCCDWWPCSWFCDVWVWITNLVCVAWVWVSNVVCVLWTTISTLICVAWTIIEILVTPLTWLWTWITAIPIVGRLLDQFINLVQTVYWRWLGLAGTALDILGIKLLKKIRLCVIILRDAEGNETVTRDGNGDPADLLAEIEKARQILRAEADIHLVLDGIHTVDNPSPEYALDVGCDLAAWSEDLGLPGTYFEAKANLHCPLGSTSHFTGYRSQIVAFCVRNVEGHLTGCTLGPLNDYLTIEGDSPSCLAHEIGHKIGLLHCCKSKNLAHDACVGTELHWWQELIVRNSKYVTYF